MGGVAGRRGVVHVGLFRQEGKMRSATQNEEEVLKALPKGSVQRCVPDGEEGEEVQEGTEKVQGDVRTVSHSVAAGAGDRRRDVPGRGDFGLRLRWLGKFRRGIG